MRVIFMGTPDYAVSVLAGIMTLVPPHQLRVVSQPDAPQGRRQRLAPSPVARYALAHNLTLDRPQRLTDLRGAWSAFAPDLIVTAAYGRILPVWLLTMGQRALNLHASLLPQWRGPNPIAWAIYNGDRETGVTLMEMAPGVDTGPIVAQRVIAIDDTSTCSSLTEQLAEAAQLLLMDSWNELLRLAAIPQVDALATHAPKFGRDMARMDWTNPASVEARRIRSMTEKPGAYTTGANQRIRLAPASIREGSMEPGRIQQEGEAWLVGCGQDLLYVTRIQPAGKAWMTPGAFMRGLRAASLEVLL